MKRLTLFAHWDKDSIIDDYVIHYINELNRVSDVIFYSDSNLSEKELSKLDGITIEYGSGKHGEYDFGSYKRAYKLAANDLGKYDQLILANDSCYGPFHALDELLLETQCNSYDYWGLTRLKARSHGDIEHLQSYFLVLNKKVLNSRHFENFILSVERKSSKKEIILCYEIGLSKLLDDLNFKRGSKIESNSLNIAYKGDCLTLIKDSKFPFIKRELLSENPYNSPELLSNLIEISKQKNGRILVHLIVKHIIRFNPRGIKKWDMPFSKQPTTIIFNRKFLRIKYGTSNRYATAKIKIFGVSLLKIPIKKLITTEQVLTRLDIKYKFVGLNQTST